MFLNQSQAQKSQSILWREWRNCRNPHYAAQLFELVADGRVGWGTRLSYTLLDAIIGMVVGLLVGFLFTTSWSLLSQLMLASGVVGAGRGLLAAQRLSWRTWLTRLAFGLPTETPNRGMLLIGLLLLLAGLIFGPVLWLLLIGLFWGMSGLITWMTKGLMTTNAYTYNRWYFWWLGRPSINEVEAALTWAAEAGLPQPASSNALEPSALSTASSPVEVDFRTLKAHARRRETLPPT